MPNILTAIQTLIAHPISDLVSYYKGRNRINQIGDALECFIKDIFADTVTETDEQKKLLKYSEVFSYSGNANNPPDLMLKNGDAVEIKKIESLGASFALNSSYPKLKLFCNSPLITSHCRTCEDWQEKDIVYAIGAENVSGILADKHAIAFTNILSQFQDAGYELAYKLLNAQNFEVPQDRKRVIIIGYREDMGGTFDFPEASKKNFTLRNAIYNLNFLEPVKISSHANKKNQTIANHEYLDSSFSSIYMSRNRVRNWDEPSFTIQAGGRHAPIHPQANKMIWLAKDKWMFDPESPKPYRRLSVRECAKIQTFPDNFIFKYKNISDGYKMVGNAVPVNLARILAKKIKEDIEQHLSLGVCNTLRRHQLCTQLTLFNAEFIPLFQK